MKAQVTRSFQLQVSQLIAHSSKLFCYLCQMRIDILTVLPELLESPFQHSILKRAQEKGLLQVHVHQLRKWAVNEYGQVDDYQYGGGAGMVMMCEPLAKAIEELSAERKYDEIIFLTPDGETLNQKTANSFSLKENLLLICGHYKGIDQRAEPIGQGPPRLPARPVIPLRSRYV